MSPGGVCQDRGLVFLDHGPQVMAEEGDLGDVEGIPGVGLAVSAGGQQPGPGRQGGGHDDHVLARAGQLLGERAAQAAGAFDGEAALGPPTPSPATSPGIDLVTSIHEAVPAASFLEEPAKRLVEAWKIACSSGNRLLDFSPCTPML